VIDWYSLCSRAELYAAWRNFTCLNPDEYADADAAMDKFFEQHDMEIREEIRQESYILGYDEGYQAGQHDVWSRVEEEYR
jgi:flagellar biosynthesis/type III secretory pathway protein FliH